ncbi:hypothetical protein BTJ40_02140 [Microbulbifer sp. A4B17]|nr:hypothetical protein BTJ40_02140 [Microbulbifer sp. A4B17]
MQTFISVTQFRTGFIVISRVSHFGIPVGKVSSVCKPGKVICYVGWLLANVKYALLYLLYLLLILFGPMMAVFFSLT